MMLKIRNDGEIALGALALLGASTKEGDETKIGFFGSGAKYALSTLLRNGIGIRLFSGVRELPVETKTVEFNGRMFEQIWIDGQPTSYTTRMGPSWEVWFAIREFICNAIDEGGYTLDVTDQIEGFEGETNVYIEMAEPVVLFYSSIDEYLLQSDPLVSVETEYGRVDILDNPSGKRAYYRKGVRICGFEETRARFRYNFASIEINESRIFSLSYQPLERVASALSVVEDESIIQEYLHAQNAGGESVEKSACWSYSSETFSEAWRRVLGQTPIYPSSCAHFLPVEDRMHGVLLPDELVKKLGEQFEDLNIWNNGDHDFVASNELEAARDTELLEEALDEVRAMGYSNDALMFEIGLFPNAPDRVAQYSLDHNRVRLSSKFMGDKNYLLATLIEEIMHSQGYPDASRKFDQHLIEELIAAKRDSMKLKALKDMVRSI